MGSRSYTWRIKDRGPNYTKVVVFWDPRTKQQLQRSTGEKDPARAAARAPSIIAKVLGGTPAPRGGQPCVTLTTEDLARDWLESLRNVLDDKTIAAYAATFDSHLKKAFPSIRDVTTSSWRAYIATRLAVVRADTVRKELSPMRGLMAWCEEQGHIDEQPHLPGIPKRATGHAYSKRRRSKPDELSPAEVRKIIDALPEFFEGKAIRSRYLLQYSMGLRSHTIDKLELGVHWRRGSDWLQLDASDLKGRVASKKRLTKDAKAALTKACEGLTDGPIFGVARHDKDHRILIRAAAQEVLKDERGDRFAPTHLRSAAITHFLDAGAPLTAAAKLADHKLLTTTDRYARPSQRALEAELKRQRRI